MSISLFLLLSAVSVISAEGEKSPQERYVERYAGMAVQEMYRSGVPASITLAQGMLESRYGESVLAVEGNNHFGIKCHNDWTGKTMRHDDDLKGECFRSYSDPSESFRDHSDFLRYRDRYRFLFDYNVTDYKSWAYGLKKAGYATDPAYPSKLIRLIEEYRLYEYDVRKAPAAQKVQKETRKVKGHNARKEKAPEAVRAAERKIPESPSRMEQVVLLSDEQREEFHFNLAREVFSKNGVPFIYAGEEDTYETIAASYGLFTRELLKFNDVSGLKPLHPGEVVYLKAKKKEASAGLDKHVMDEDETLQEISQRYAVKLSRIYRMNGFTDDYVPREGDVIRLRRK